MRAIVVDRWMEPADLRVREAPELELAPDTLAVEVRAAGCNFFDLLMVRGQYQVKPPFPFIPGAERAVVPARSAWRMPAEMSFEAGASFPIVYPTSYAGLVFRAGLRRGETLLVHAAAGGVGIAAVQIGKALGARVIATAGGADKLAVARRAGADVAIDYRGADWVDQVRAATAGHGADVIYDPVGGDVFDASLKCIAWNGRLLVIGFASGRIPEVKLNRVLLKNIALVGLHWGAHALHQPERIAETLAALLALYREGKVEPVVYRTYLLEELPAALEALGSRQSYGKVVVAP